MQHHATVLDPPPYCYIPNMQLQQVVAAASGKVHGMCQLLPPLSQSCLQVSTHPLISTCPHYSSASLFQAASACPASTDTNCRSFAASAAAGAAPVAVVAVSRGASMLPVRAGRRLRLSSMAWYMACVMSADMSLRLCRSSPLPLRLPPVSPGVPPADPSATSWSIDITPLACCFCCCMALLGAIPLSLATTASSCTLPSGVPAGPAWKRGRAMHPNVTPCIT
mmetsp:Transcript_23127/g.50763  ORF Transcript_23127/g.50763 Transcript_23127/m.50763 type:complete len:223 (+) Transcript_23127:2273-2941(+)